MKNLINILAELMIVALLWADDEDVVCSVGFRDIGNW